MAVRLPEAKGLHLRRTLDSGQTFRWSWETDAGGQEIAAGIIGRRVVRLAQDAQGLWLISPGTSEARDVLLRYLGIASADGTGIGSIEDTLAKDPVLARILPRTRGIGLLAQDPWEVLISFVISQNNNIPKIVKSIERLCRALGEPLDAGAYAFPSPARLASAHPRTLAASLLGYRAPYVRAAARHVADGRLDLEALRHMPESSAREVLCGVPGIGDKVGDCILLFGLGHMTAFPVDVWVRRAVERLYFRNRPRPIAQIRVFARDRFGSLAGYAQQHLYAYARAHLRTERRHGIRKA